MEAGPVKAHGPKPSRHDAPFSLFSAAGAEKDLLREQMLPRAATDDFLGERKGVF